MAAKPKSKAKRQETIMEQNPVPGDGLMAGGGEATDAAEHEDERIRRKAYDLWVEEGQPDGRAEQHWQMAREIIATKDSYGDTTIPVGDTLEPPVEPAEALENTGEFPTLTDQGEMQPPRR